MSTKHDEIYMECINCDYCDAQCDVPTKYAAEMHHRFGGFFCSADCKTDWVYAEFDHMMQSNGMH